MKNILKRIGLIALAVFVGVGSLFVSSPTSLMASHFASADSTQSSNITFVSSDIVFARPGIKDVQTPNSTDSNGLLNFSQYTSYPGNTFTEWLDFSFYLSTPDFESSTGGFYEIVNFTARGVLDPPRYGIGHNVSTGVTDLNIHTITAGEFGESGPDSYQFFSDFFYLFTGSTTAEFDTALGCGIYYPSTLDNGQVTFPTLKMVSIEIGSYYNFPERENFPSAFAYSHVIAYTDTDGFKFYFFIPAHTSNTSSYVFYQYRKYYTNYSSQFNNNEFYTQGYSDGLVEGESLGRDLGYTEGQSAGYLAGKQAGYNEGAEDANKYTFLSLIGAVVDAPITAFSSMFDFDLLGVNLRDFFFAILTFCFLTILVKFALMKG